MKTTSKVLIVAITILFFFLPVLVHAQADPMEDPDTPIDGGVSLLVAAGVGYGVKKVRDMRKKKQEGSEK